MAASPTCLTCVAACPNPLSMCHVLLRPGTQGTGRLPPPPTPRIFTRGSSALHLNEATWIINGSNELTVDFLFALVLFLDSTQPRPFKNPKQIF